MEYIHDTVTGPRLVLPTIAHAIEIKTKQNNSRCSNMPRNKFRTRRLLIMLDNAAEVLPDVASALNRLSEHRALAVTLGVASRERLQVSGRSRLARTFPARFSKESSCFIAPSQSLRAERARSTDCKGSLHTTRQPAVDARFATAPTAVFSPEQGLQRVGRRLVSSRATVNRPAAADVRATIGLIRTSCSR